jgi:hypothetical protein
MGGSGGPTPRASAGGAALASPRMPSAAAPPAAEDLLQKYHSAEILTVVLRDQLRDCKRRLKQLTADHAAKARARGARRKKERGGRCRCRRSAS